jgi:pimeloyl-ACP methyl ester carboxylesterase
VEAVLPAFEERFSVLAVDRRGRGESGDSDGYEIEREFEDVAAVVDSLGESVNLLGHSYGALVALEAALLTENVRKLVLYDPGIEVAGEEVSPPEVIERLEALLEAGDRDGVVATTMREVAGLPPKRWSTCGPSRMASASRRGAHDPAGIASGQGL